MIAAARFTVEELFKLCYNQLELEVDNPHYKESHPSCEHYSSVEAIGDDLFCPKCGTKNKVITYPKTITQINYQLSDGYQQYFTENKFPEGSASKDELVKIILQRLFCQKKFFIHQQGFLLDADANANGLIWFCKNYVDCERCYYTFEEYLKRASLDELLKNNFYLICHRLTQPCSEELKQFFKKVELFEEVGLQLKYCSITPFMHYDCLY